jgi:signal transduction histidine kinase
LRLNIERLDVRDVVQRVEKSMRPLASASDVKLDVRLPDEELTVEGDDPQLEQVLTNLLSNGIKFTPPGGTVVTEALHEPDPSNPMVVLRVHDTGIGIPASEIPDLATRFFRASNAVAAAFPGTGLGLAIVSEVVERHGGSVIVGSTVGHGTTVTVRLPMA